MRTRSAEFLTVTVLLLFAAALRITGIGYGSPDMSLFPSETAQNLLPIEVPIHPDEVLYVATPLHMRAQRRITVDIYENPLLLTNINLLTDVFAGIGAALTWDDVKDINSRQLGPFSLYVVTRVYSMLGGLLAVAAIYAAARLLSGRFGGLTAGLIAAVTLPLVQHAHYATTSSIAAGFVALCVWATLAYVRSRRAWLLILAGIAAGLAASSRYNAAAVALIPFAVGVIALARWRVSPRIVIAAWIAAPLAFVAGTPQILRDFGGFWHDFRFIFGAYTGGGEAVDRTSYGLLFEYRYLIVVALGIPGALTALIGAGTLWRKHRLTLSLLLVYLIPYSVVVLRTAIPAHADQLLLPAIPVFALLIGVGAAALAELRVVRPVRAAIPALLVVTPLMFTLPVAQRFAATDTRLLMTAWINEHVPAGARIALDGSYNVPLDQERYTLTQYYGGELPPLETLCDADYIVVSDAWYNHMARSWEIVAPEYRENVREHLAMLDANFTEIARLDRPNTLGSDLIMHTATYWHDPGIGVYRVDGAACE